VRLVQNFDKWIHFLDFLILREKENINGPLLPRL
ncbi:unnamed protein product, partial [marine sediment metagenome]